eukprot:GHVU01160400.1.p3 GENE.GHVU01160400.1~~GHVU01160400.1.p3  ORF type:complete len:101 (-),score=7.75 GHVU01160400.1:357-659(-)
MISFPLHPKTILSILLRVRENILHFVNILLRLASCDFLGVFMLIRDCRRLSSSPSAPSLRLPPLTFSFFIHFHGCRRRNARRFLHFVACREAREFQNRKF